MRKARPLPHLAAVRLAGTCFGVRYARSVPGGGYDRAGPGLAREAGAGAGGTRGHDLLDRRDCCLTVRAWLFMLCVPASCPGFLECQQCRGLGEGWSRAVQPAREFPWRLSCLAITSRRTRAFSASEVIPPSMALRHALTLLGHKLFLRRLSNRADSLEAAASMTTASFEPAERLPERVTTCLSRWPFCAKYAASGPKSWPSAQALDRHGWLRTQILRHRHFSEGRRAVSFFGTRAGRAKSWAKAA